VSQDDADPGLGPDLEVLATQVVAWMKKNKRPTPKVAELAGAITDLSISDTMTGSSTLTLHVSDAEHELTDSGFFDVDRNGRLNAIDLNYPEGGPLWWRLTQVQFNGTTVDMVFMERAAVHLDHHYGPLKRSRGKSTRAEFLKSLCDKVKVDPITFRTHELHKTQPLAKADKTERDTKRQAAKDGGINRSEQITFTNWDGSDYTFTPGELDNAEQILDAAFDSTNDELALEALMCACIVEGPFCRNPSGGEGTSAGILQLTAGKGTVEQRRDIPRVVGLFLNDGFYGKRDPSAKGAIDLAKKHKDWTPGEIAQETQGSAYADRYQKVLDGARALIEAYGGASGDDQTYRKQYNFEVGSPEKPHESYWEAMNRLAQEVRWALFVDGQNVYYDSEKVLIKQKPAAIVDRDDPALLDVRGTWDNRKIATEVEVDLVCGPFEFRAGEVLKLRNLGPLSSGSTAKLPGRWLIDTIERTRSALFSTFTLKQPHSPAPEPLSELAERSQDDSGSDHKIYEVCKAISDQNRPYLWGGGHKKFSQISAKEGLDCSGSVSLALFRAEKWNLGDAGVDSGTLARTWGKPGRGKDFTVWANATHVFLQSEPGTEGGGRGPWRFDTSGGPPDGPQVRGSHRSTDGFTPRHWGTSRKESQHGSDSGSSTDLTYTRFVPRGGDFWKGADNRVYYNSAGSYWFLATSHGMVPKNGDDLPDIPGLPDGPVAKEPDWVSYKRLRS
jgi:hypothetical protein